VADNKATIRWTSVIWCVSTNSQSGEGNLVRSLLQRTGLTTSVFGTGYQKRSISVPIFLNSWVSSIANLPKLLMINTGFISIRLKDKYNVFVNRYDL
jgi:hypothetical protein